MFGVTVSELGAFHASSNSMNHSDLQDSPYEEAVTCHYEHTNKKLPFFHVDTKVTFLQHCFLGTQ